MPHLTALSLGVRPVALIQNQPQIVRTTVKYEAIALDTDSPHCCIRRHLIEQLILAPELNLSVDQGRLLGTPEQFVAVVINARVGKCYAPLNLSIDYFVGIVHQQLVANAQFHLYLYAIVPLTSNSSVKANLPALKVGVQ